MSTSRRMLTAAAVAMAQVLLVGLGVAPQLSARLTGTEHRVRVELFDPIDPFRGAYVALSYPDLEHGRDRFDDGLGTMDDGRQGRLFIVLAERDGIWEATEWTRERPADGTYLACDDTSWQVRCGIESWFLPQDEAMEMERELAAGGLATLRIDRRGNAALVDVTGR